MKGFRLAGSRDGVKPVVVLEGSWSIAEGSYLSSLEFDNIEFRHEANNNYFMNTSKAYTIENVSFVNCDFISLRRGFWRHQSANAKYIMNLEMEGCRFEGCGWQTSAYGAFNLQSFFQRMIADDSVISVLDTSSTSLAYSGRASVEALT